MLEAVGNLNNNISESNNYNYAVPKERAGSVFDKAVQTGKNDSVKVDWLNVDKQLKDILFNDGSLSTILSGKKKVRSLSPSARRTERTETIENEKNHISKVVTQRTAYNTNQLKKAGISERQVYKYLTYDGHVTDEGKRILREHGLSYK